MPSALLPDAEVLMVDFLATHPNLTALVGERVGTGLDNDLPAIRVTRMGRAPTATWEDVPELQLECWAETQNEASVLARTVVSVLPDVVGEHAEGAVRGWAITLGPLWSPDPDTDLARYLVDVSLLTYPNV